MYQLSRSIYRELAPEILEDPIAPTAADRTTSACCAPARPRSTAWRPIATTSPSRPRRCSTTSAIYFPMSRAGPRLPRGRPLHDVRPRVVRGAADRAATTSRATASSAARRRARARRASACRCRTTATARRTSTSPRRRSVRRSTRRGRPGRRLTGSLARRCASASSGWGSWARARRRTCAARGPRADRLQPHPRDAPRRGPPSTAATVADSPREVAERRRRRDHDGGRRRAGRGRCCSARTAPSHGARRGHAVHRHVDDRARPTRAASAATLHERGHGFVDAPGDRLGAEGRGRHADDHVRRQRRGHRARAAAARGDGREDRPRRRGRPGPGGQGASPTRSAPSTAPRSPRRWWSAAAPTSTSRRCSR